MEENTSIKCSDFCGFSVSGEAEYCRRMFQQHDHEERRSLFSIPGMIIVFIVCGAVVAIINKTPF